MATAPSHVDREFRRFYLLRAHHRHRHERARSVLAELLPTRMDAGDNTEDQYVWQHKNG
jgi:hypothetical protein|eukprot:COSAG02_NODE_2022_length_10084_cov_2.725643_10_plen_59_part_00